MPPAANRSTRRTGSIHAFDGPADKSLALFNAAPPIPPAGIPVEVIDGDTLSPLGSGRLVAASVVDDDLMGTVEWSRELDDMAGDRRPSVHCTFAGDGSIRKVVVEMGGDEVDADHGDGHDADHDHGDDGDCGCGCGGTCEFCEPTDPRLKLWADIAAFARGKPIHVPAPSEIDP